MAGAELFGRDATLIVDTIKIACRDQRNQSLRPSLRFAFKVTRSHTKDPNTCEITVYNLSKDHRALLHKKDVSVALEVGYVGNTHQIFKGNLQFGQSVLDGNDWKTTMQSGDGAKNLASARVNLSIKGPVDVGAALKQIASKLGLGLGNTDEKAGAGGLRGLSEFAQGLVLSGDVKGQIDKVAKSMGLGWSIQDEKLVFLGPNESLAGQEVLLRPGTGLIGSPEQGEKGLVKCRSRIQPGLSPGYAVRIKSREVDGRFRIEKSTYVGDTWGADWHVEIECRPLG